MFKRTYISLVILALCCEYCYNCLKIVPERAVIKYVNEKYFTNVSTSVRRSRRRGEYVFNMKLISKIVMANNVTMHMIVYEHNTRYNQYVRTLIEFNYKICDLILRDIWFGPTIRNHGISECPVPPGPIVLANMSFSGNFPFNVWFDKGKLEGVWKIGPTGEEIGSLDVFVSFTKTS